MKLKVKKIIAKEILVFAVLIIVIPLIYFSFDLFDKKIEKSNSETSIKISNISNEIKTNADSLQNLQRHLNLTEAVKAVNPSEQLYKNGTQKLNPNKEIQIYDEYGIQNKIYSKKDSLMIVSFKNQILKLAEQQKILESQLISNIDLKSWNKYSIMILFILAYPVRFLIISIIWSLKTLNRREGSNYVY